MTRADGAFGSPSSTSDCGKRVPTQNELGPGREPAKPLRLCVLSLDLLDALQRLDRLLSTLRTGQHVHHATVLSRLERDAHTRAPSLDETLSVGTTGRRKKEVNESTPKPEGLTTPKATLRKKTDPIGIHSTPRIRLPQLLGTAQSLRRTICRKRSSL
jgi:hypothetical protein